MQIASSANPILEIVPDRQAAKRYGLNIADIHETIQTGRGWKDRFHDCRRA